MTDRSKAVAPYQVGYRRPPVASQFKRGASGNPNGRPRKQAAGPVRSTAHAELDDILLKEALRPITVRENDELIEMPMIQAVLRSLGVAAVKGHHRSQLAITQMVKSVQSAQFEAKKSLFESAIEHKNYWREVFEDCDRRGVPRPDPVPHPDDVVIDANTMGVRFNGPSCDDEKGHWDRMLARREAALEEIADCRARLKRKSQHSEFWESELASEQKLADMIAAIIPDEKTRRVPGFDIQAWRESKPAYREMVARQKGKKKRNRAG